MGAGDCLHVYAYMYGQNVDLCMYLTDHSVELYML